MRRTCCSSVAGFLQRAALRRIAISSSSGMLLQRKNDSRDASSKSPRRNGAPGATARRLALEAEQELRVDEHARDRPLDAASRTCRARARRDRTAAASPCPAPAAARADGRRATRACRGSFARTRSPPRCSWRADEQPTTARRVAGARRVERTGDRHLRDARRARRRVEDAVGARRRACADDHRGRDRVRSRRHRQARRAAPLQRDALVRRASRTDRRRAAGDGRRRDARRRRPRRSPGRTRHRAETCGE